ncbi:MAG TPA: hypothetical protein VF945_09080 [Polyangia bacterium]
MKRWILATLLGVAGCATGGAKTAQRFTGYPYDVHDEGNRVSGLVCGLDVDLSVAHRGDATVVSGFGGRSVYIEVRDQDGTRRVTGSLGAGPDRGELDLTLTADRLRGRAGIRDVDLAAVGDTYQGQYKVRNQPTPAPMTVEGRGELLKLPPAELGALMPSMLNCEGPVGHPVQWTPVAVRFGGPPGYETRAANDLP